MLSGDLEYSWMVFKKNLQRAPHCLNMFEHLSTTRNHVPYVLKHCEDRKHMWIIP